MRQWLKVVRRLNKEQREGFAHDELVEEGAMMVSNIVWFTEYKKDARMQNWVSVIECLKELTETALEMNFELLWACSIRAQAIIMAEYLNDLEGAAALIVDALKSISEDQRVYFILNEVIARELAFADKAESASWFQDALSVSIQAYPFERLDTCLVASRSLGKHDVGQGLYYAKLALDLAKSIKDIPKLYRVKVFCEYALAQGLNGDFIQTLFALAETAEELLSCKEDTEEWQGLFTLFGHMSGYFSSLVTTAKPPMPRKGEEKYACPRLGMFVNENREAHKFYKPIDGIIAQHIGLMADSLGYQEIATKWMVKAYYLGQESPIPSFQALATMTIPFLIKSNMFAEAITSSIESFVWLQAWAEAKPEANLEGLNFNPKEIIGPKPSTKWNVIEQNVVSRCLVPIMFHLSNLWISDKDQAHAYVDQILECCKSVAVNASDKQIWYDIISIFSGIFFQKKSIKDIISLANSLRHDGLKVMCYTGVMLIGTLQDAVRFQQAMMGYIEGTKHDRVSYYYLVLPFFTEFWRQGFQQQRFQFRSPSLIEGELKAIVDSKVLDNKILKIFNLMAFGLGLR